MKLYACEVMAESDVLADSLNNEESFRGDVSGAVNGVPVLHHEVETPFVVFSGNRSKDYREHV